MSVRSATLPALIALLLALALPGSAAAAPAKQADAFVDSVGVNTHLGYDDTAYHSRFEEVRARLAELGVRHIREDLLPDRPDQYERLASLAAAGIGSTLIVGKPAGGPEGLERLLGVVRNDVRGSVEALEGPNEIDMFGDATWLPHLGGYQASLFAAAKSDPGLAPLPVLGPSLVHRRNQEALGDISGALDFGNIHPYPDGAPPEANIASHLERAALNSAGKPVFATESGYHTGLGWQGEHRPVSEAAMATYIPRLYLEYFRRGILRTFSYELLDQGNGGEREESFGLLRNDLQPKPAFAALRNTIQVLADPGPAFAPAPLGYSLSGDREGVRDLLLQKRDGSYYLALWRTDSVWDPDARRPLAAPSRPVTIDFERQVTSAQAFHPTSDLHPRPIRPRMQNGSRGRLTVDVGPEVTILRVVPGGPVPQRIQLWVSRRSVPAGGRVAVRGRLPAAAVGRPVQFTIQHLRKGRWRPVQRGRASKVGSFRKALRLSPSRFGRVPKLRVVAKVAKPSRSVKLRIKGRDKARGTHTLRRR